MKKVTAKTSSGTSTICAYGHRYVKSSACPTCPVCEAGRKPNAGFLSAFSAPARRALERIGVDTARKLSRYSEKEILALHGMGKASLPALRKALQDAGLSFRSLKEDKAP